MPQHEGPDTRDEEMSEATSRLMAAGTLLANGESLRGLAGGSRQRSVAVDTTPPEEVDIAIITVLPEEFAAVRQRLENPQLAAGLAERPNSYAWETATLPGRSGDYRVVLAMAGRPGNISGALVTVDTVERWHPRYVIMVGIAGGLAPGIALGDVVVSTTIYGYEYGKLLADKFQPRTAFVYATDGALVSSSKRMAVIGDGWRSSLSPHPEPFAPKVFHGEVASGEKVVDSRNASLFREILQVWPNLSAVEMEGAGAAGAIEALRSRQTIGFAMVRGISDIPPGTSVSGQPADAGVVQSRQRDKSKVIASDTAAAFVIHWITQGWPVLPKVRKE